MERETIGTLETSSPRVVGGTIVDTLSCLWEWRLTNFLPALKARVEKDPHAWGEAHEALYHEFFEYILAFMARCTGEKYKANEDIEKFIVSFEMLRGNLHRYHSLKSCRSSIDSTSSNPQTNDL